jgi:Fe-S-cluster containining protein
MKKLNVQYFVRRGRAKKKKLGLFLKALARKKPRGIHKTLKEAEQATWKEVSCVTCGHCCAEMTPTWRKSEIKRVAAHMGMTYNEYYEKYLYTEEKSGDIMNDSTPCQHYNLKTRMCTIYEIRPLDCAEFPHFHRKDFYDQVNDVFTPNIPRCPATLVWVEKIEELVKAKG